MWDESKVRIKDIADELGVSTATVSNVLHGKTKKISDATIKRVEKKLEERGYIPNIAAALLARNDSRIIGVVVNDHEKYEGRALEDPFIASALNYLSDEIEDEGYFMMLKKAHKVMDIVRFASMWNLDGMVEAGSISPVIGRVFKLNPFYYIVSGYRDALIHKVAFWEKWDLTLYFWIFAVIQFLLGQLIYRRLKPHFADVL